MQTRALRRLPAHVPGENLITAIRQRSRYQWFDHPEAANTLFQIMQIGLIKLLTRLVATADQLIEIKQTHPIGITTRVLGG